MPQTMPTVVEQMSLWVDSCGMTHLLQSLARVCAERRNLDGPTAPCWERMRVELDRAAAVAALQLYIG